MRIKLDITGMSIGRDGPAEKPYPSWDEMVSQLRRERFARPQSQPSERQVREWHDLVADMIIRR